MEKLTLRGWRVVKGISQTELAKALNTTQACVSKWERGKAKMPVEKAAEACEYIGVNIGDVNFFAKE